MLSVAFILLDLRVITILDLNKKRTYIFCPFCKLKSAIGLIYVITLKCKYIFVYYPGEILAINMV
jgi:hypothetical protein